MGKIIDIPYQFTAQNFSYMYDCFVGDLEEFAQVEFRDIRTVVYQSDNPNIFNTVILFQIDFRQCPRLYALQAFPFEVPAYLLELESFHLSEDPTQRCYAFVGDVGTALDGEVVEEATAVPQQRQDAVVDLFRVGQVDPLKRV